MHTQDTLSAMRDVRQRMSKMETWLRIMAMGWLATISLLLFSWTGKDAQTSDFTPDSLRVRKLVIVDEKNNERIVIAAPLPDPMVNGEVRPRRDAVTAGIQFKDVNGTERGGIAAVENGSFVVGIDDETGQERAHLYYIPSRGSGVYLQGEKGQGVVSLLLPKGSNPVLEMKDKDGKRVNPVRQGGE